MTDKDPLTWNHRKGDEYVVAVGSVVGNEKAWEIVYEVSRQTHDRLGYAISEGFVDWERNDDFNIVAIRDEKPAALLWMDEITDENVPEEIVIDLANR